MTPANFSGKAHDKNIDSPVCLIPPNFRYINIYIYYIYIARKKKLRNLSPKYTNYYQYTWGGNKPICFWSLQIEWLHIVHHRSWLHLLGDVNVPQGRAMRSSVWLDLFSKMCWFLSYVFCGFQGKTHQFCCILGSGKFSFFLPEVLCFLLNSYISSKMTWLLVHDQ